MDKAGRYATAVNVFDLQGRSVSNSNKIDKAGRYATAVNVFDLQKQNKRFELKLICT